VTEPPSTPAQPAGTHIAASNPAAVPTVIIATMRSRNPNRLFIGLRKEFHHTIRTAKQRTMAARAKRCHADIWQVSGTAAAQAASQHRLGGSSTFSLPNICSFDEDRPRWCPRSHHPVPAHARRPSAIELGIGGVAEREHSFYLCAGHYAVNPVNSRGFGLVRRA
jgi:hypothetical protein